MCDKKPWGDWVKHCSDEQGVSCLGLNRCCAGAKVKCGKSQKMQEIIIYQDASPISCSFNAHLMYPDIMFTDDFKPCSKGVSFREPIIIQNAKKTSSNKDPEKYCMIGRLSEGNPLYRFVPKTYIERYSKQCQKSSFPYSCAGFNYIYLDKGRCKDDERLPQLIECDV